MIVTLVASVAASLAQGGPVDRVAILDSARAPATKRLGKPVKFKVRTIRREGDWAFVIAAMVDAAGRPISYAGTPLASAEAEGAVSKDFVALLRLSGGRWRVVDHALGPTDVAWMDWADKHGAPPSLFDLQ
ncbi:MAG: hypothetical protein J7500_11800 [Sphingomonas sp.]|uniref:hypothetical protein n=1 Tax=Sphingomonas sp. TaxID=28214 RepID=UPI001B288138|nr:hypothetical protein [Sphingomonas sp.]MBO9623383.1 hypothetical protein [Sphingomonas sp.]